MWNRSAQRYLTHKKSGVDTRLHSWGGRKRRLSFLVAIAIAALDDATKAMVDALDRSSLRADVKGAGRADCHVPHIGAHFLARGDDGAHQIARLKPLDALVLLGAGPRE